MFFLVDSNNLSAMIKNDKPVTGCALIQGCHIIGHGLSSFRENEMYLNTASLIFRFLTDYAAIPILYS